MCLYPVHNTLQVKDYSRYDMRSFSEEEKKSVHEMCFPTDLEGAYELGARLSQ